MKLLHFALFYCGFLIILIGFAKCSVRQKVKKRQVFIAFFDFSMKTTNPAPPAGRWGREILEKF